MIFKSRNCHRNCLSCVDCSMGSHLDLSRSSNSFKKFSSFHALQSFDSGSLRLSSVKLMKEEDMIESPFPRPRHD